MPKKIDEIIVFSTVVLDNMNDFFTKLISFDFSDFYAPFGTNKKFKIENIQLRIKSTDIERIPGETLTTKMKNMCLIVDEIIMKNSTNFCVIICAKSKQSYNFIRKYIGKLPNNQNSTSIIFQQNPESNFDFQILLEDLKPQYVIFFDFDLPLIRSAYTFKLNTPKHPLRCYTMTPFNGKNMLQKQLQTESIGLAKVRNLKLLEDPNKSKIEMEPMKLIFFDLETTGIKRDSGIVEIAAWAQDVDKYTLPEIYEDKIQSKDIFYKLVLPDKRMNPQASKVNGIKKMGKYNLSVRGVLHRNVKIPRFALGDFVTWLESFKNVKLVLVAHNGNKFDIPVLTNQLTRLNLIDRFIKRVDLAGDTFVTMKEKFGPKKKLKLTVLGEEYIPNWNNYGGKAHSALFDVWVMISVMKYANFYFTPENFKSIESLLPLTSKANEKITCDKIEDFRQLTDRGCITVKNAIDIANKNISYDVLESTSKNCSQIELMALLKGVFETKDALISISKIREFFND